MNESNIEHFWEWHMLEEEYHWGRASGIGHMAILIGSPSVGWHSRKPWRKWGS